MVTAKSQAFSVLCPVLWSGLPNRCVEYCHSCHSGKNVKSFISVAYTVFQHILLCFELVCCFSLVYGSHFLCPCKFLLLVSHLESNMRRWNINILNEMKQDWITIKKSKNSMA